MSSKTVTIIGGGLAGLSLGLCLKSRGIVAVIYDRHVSHPRSNYGINLYRSTYLPLLPHLGIDESAFKEQVAINLQVDNEEDIPIYGDDPLRCHRGRLEKLLRADLAVRWNKKVASVELDSESKSVIASFDDGERIATKNLVGCDGPHSTVRKSLCSKSQLKVLPYLVVNGTRRVSLDEYRHIFSEESAPLRIFFSPPNLRLEITINDVTDEYADLSNTYSRPANGEYPDIHEPNRSKADAAKMPQTFFDDMEKKFSLHNIFKYDERRLHWLMRTVRPDRDELVDLASKGVVLIGDAAHAEPIIGGEGANGAIKDAVKLAESISERSGDGYNDFLASRFDEWVESVETSEAVLAACHNDDTFQKFAMLP